MERHCSNTLALAQYLDQHPMVTWVSYPVGLYKLNPVRHHSLKAHGFIQPLNLIT
jgi:O-acetylhomoserine/O-acetylserine sulfhydrylase-like pyridoxal-dependent enzyme